MSHALLWKKQSLPRLRQDQGRRLPLVGRCHFLPLRQHRRTRPNLKISDVIDIDGKPWALVRTGSGYDNQAHVFRPHQEKSAAALRRVPDSRQELLTRQAKRSIARVSLERFFDAYRAAWDVNDLHTLNTHQLNEAIKVIEGAARIGRDISRSVDSIWREHHDLRDLHKGAFEACLKSINAQVKELPITASTTSVSAQRR